MAGLGPHFLLTKSLASVNQVKKKFTPAGEGGSGQ